MIVNAYFDGERIILDEPVNLEPYMKLRVEIDDGDLDTAKEREEWFRFSMSAFAELTKDEPDIYTNEMIIERNPHFHDRSK